LGEGRPDWGGPHKTAAVWFARPRSRTPKRTGFADDLLDLRGGLLARIRQALSEILRFGVDGPSGPGDLGHPSRAHSSYLPTQAGADAVVPRHLRGPAVPFTPRGHSF